MSGFCFWFDIMTNQNDKTEKSKRLRLQKKEKRTQQRQDCKKQPQKKTFFCELSATLLVLYSVVVMLLFVLSVDSCCILHWLNILLQSQYFHNIFRNIFEKRKNTYTFTHIYTDEHSQY